MSPTSLAARAAAALLCYGALSAGLAACGSGEAAAWVGRVHGLSAQADRALAADALPEAEAALAALIEGPVPAAVAADDRRALLQDAWARRALLRLQSGRPADAESAAAAGLALGAGGDAYEATLLILRGRAREAQGHDAQAAADYDRAAALDEKLLGALLHPSDASPGTDR
jgi:hypothetical protein